MNSKIWKQTFNQIIIIFILLCQLSAIGQTANWLKLGKDLKGDSLNDQFGKTTAISGNGDVIAIASWYNEKDSHTGGLVRIFRWDGNKWVQKGLDLRGWSSNEKHGYSLALNYEGTVLACGVPESDGTGYSRSGKVLIFEWNGQRWMNELIYSNQETEVQAGTSLALDSAGTSIIIGEPATGSGKLGHAYVLTTNGNGWLERGNVPENANSENWATAVDISPDGNTIVVAGSRSKNPQNKIITGACAVYSWNETTSKWDQKGDTLYGKEYGESFGSSCALSRNGDRMVVGSSENRGKVYTYSWNGSQWQLIGSILKGNKTNDLLGTSIDLSSNGQVMCLNSWKGDSGSTVDCGHVKLVRWNGFDWEQLGPTIFGDSISDVLGYCAKLSADGSRLVTGMHGSDIGGWNKGLVRAYEIDVHSSVQNIMTPSIVKVYPNPAQNQVEIRSDHIINSLSLLDLGGKEVLHTKPSFKSKEVRLDVSGLESGIYVLEIRSEGFIQRKKIQISKY